MLSCLVLCARAAAAPTVLLSVGGTVQYGNSVRRPPGPLCVFLGLPTSLFLLVQVLDCILKSCLGIDEEYRAMGTDLSRMVAGEGIMGDHLGVIITDYHHA
jgi:hypothetical protein